jgi:hypothetical protein
MTNKSDLEHSGKLKSEVPSSLADDTESKLTDIDQTHSEKEEIKRPTRVTKSKREIMEELSRERFPWEE